MLLPQLSFSNIGRGGAPAYNASSFSDQDATGTSSSSYRVKSSSRKCLWMLLIAGVFTSMEFTTSAVYYKRMVQAVAHPPQQESVHETIHNASTIEAKGDDLATQAEQELGEAKGSFSSKEQHTYEEAATLMEVADADRVAGFHRKAGEAYRRAAEIHLAQLNSVNHHQVAANYNPTTTETSKEAPHPLEALSSHETTNRQRLLNQWKLFEAYWSNDMVLADYVNHTSKATGQNEVPHIQLPDFIPSSVPHAKQDIVLASHMSVGQDKLDRLGLAQRFWRGPISLAVRIRSHEEINLFFDYYESNADLSTNWTIHFVLEYAKEPAVDSRSYAAQYCHNDLRNLALHSPSIPDFVLAVDLDFIPTYGGYPKLMQIMKEHPDLWDKMMKHNKLLVLPVMEVLHIPDSWGMNATTLVATLKNIITTSQQVSTTNSSTITTNMTAAASTNLTLVHSNSDQLVQDLKNLQIFEKGVESDLPKSREDLHVMYQYHLARQWHTPQGHGPTDLNRYWKYQQEEEEETNDTNKNTTTSASIKATIQWRKRPKQQKPPTYNIKATIKYEPYFIGYKPKLPQYWEGFRGYGLNKQSFVRECLLLGMEMEALYELYLTHLAHPSNRNTQVLQTNQKEWTTKFQPYLESKYTTKAQWMNGHRWFSEPT